MLSAFVSSLLIAVSTVTASPFSDVHRVFESVHCPQEWVSNSKPTPDTWLNVQINLAQQNVGAFQRKLIDLSTPNHPSYGHHMSSTDIKSMLKPSDDTVNAVKSWLNTYGEWDNMRVESDWIHMTANVSRLEAMLNTEYRIFKNIRTGEEKIRTLSYSLPKQLHGHISMIHPTTRIGGPEPLRSTISYIEPATKPGLQRVMIPAGAAIDAACNSSITPACLQDLYSFGNYTPTDTVAKMGVGGFLEQWAQYSDLESFLAKYDPEDADESFDVELINGGTNNQTNSTNAGEADLDIQYAVGISRTIPVTYYSTGGRPPIVGNGTNDNEPYLEFLQYLLDLDDEDLPRTVSISYGESESSVPLSYADSVCSLFSQVGARGVSILTASGDGGPGGSCLSSNGTKMFTPIFPGGCPFVTAVGATHYVEPESAIAFSGGGFSNYWARPDWQDADVQAYLDAGYSSNFSQYFNSSGRAYPDVAAQGSNFHVIYHGSDVLIGGTSASTPAFSSIINLVSNELMAQGKSPLGFLNPWLYSTGRDGLTDITTGTSTGCGSTIPNAGFPGVEGWDAVTGLGTPVFTALLEAAGL